jgi:glycerol-3-phosphate cytidylyltransferase-like family protein
LIKGNPIKVEIMGESSSIVEGVVLVSREEIERMKVFLDEMLERVMEKEKLDYAFEAVNQKIGRLDERIRNIEALLETAVNLIQELIFISSGETIAMKEQQASVKQDVEENRYELEEQTQKVDKAKIEEEEVTRTSSWDMLGQRPKVSLHDVERELERLFSRMAELEVAREEKRITESEYLMVMEALKDKKEKITGDLDKLFNFARK